MQVYLARHHRATFRQHRLEVAIERDAYPGATYAIAYDDAIDVDETRVAATKIVEVDAVVIRGFRQGQQEPGDVSAIAGNQKMQALLVQVLEPCPRNEVHRGH